MNPKLIKSNPTLQIQSLLGKACPPWIPMATKAYVIGKALPNSELSLKLGYSRYSITNMVEDKERYFLVLHSWSINLKLQQLRDNSPCWNFYFVTFPPQPLSIDLINRATCTICFVPESSSEIWGLQAKGASKFHACSMLLARKKCTSFGQPLIIR